MYSNRSPAWAPENNALNVYLVTTTVWSKVESWVRRFKSCNRHVYLFKVDQQELICIWCEPTSTDVCLTWANMQGYIWRGTKGTDDGLMWTNIQGYMADVDQQARIYVWRGPTSTDITDMDQQARIYMWRGERHIRQTCTAVRSRPFQLWHYQRLARSTQIAS
jgi:hypothetical protein